MTPDVVVNGRFLARRLTGIERHGRELLRRIGGGYRMEFTRAQGLPGHAWEQMILPARLSRRSILWSPANTGPLVTRRQALTIHDLSPLEHPEWFRPGFAIWYRILLPILARRVVRVFAPSEYVRGKVMRRFGITAVTVTANGVDRAVFHPDAQQSRFELPLHYILFVGTLEPRKNLQALLGAWRDVSMEHPDVWLIIAGARGTVFTEPVLAPPVDRVRFLGYVDDVNLPGLYAGAMLFVLPSRDEGFGLPALEAMASGAPVLVSNGGALPEVVGEAAMTFSLSDPRALPVALNTCLGDAGLRARLREKGMERAQSFSWEASAEIVRGCLHEL